MIPETRNQKNNKGKDKELDDIEYLPPAEMSAKKPPAIPNAAMSAGAVEAAKKALANLSEADADVGHEDTGINRWTAEDVYLSHGYTKKMDMGNHKLKWTAYSIVVLFHCAEDKDLVTATAIAEPKRRF